MTTHTLLHDELITAGSIALVVMLCVVYARATRRKE
jgi:hypothetical protein